MAEDKSTKIITTANPSTAAAKTNAAVPGATKAAKQDGKELPTGTADQLTTDQASVAGDVPETKGSADAAVTTEKAPKGDSGPSKMDIAMGIWDAMPNAERKDVIAVFIDKAKLTKAGASTYYALIKAKKAKQAK
jgi:uncharacterized protein with beta-barrel porin domain